jgi:proteasome lid subunit RPN8/RPN11
VSVFVDAWGDPIEGSGWALGRDRDGAFVERPKPGAPGTTEHIRLRSGSAMRSRSSVASPRRPSASVISWTRPEDVELRESSVSPISVVLDGGARSCIFNEVLDWASDGYGDGRESGGYLFGRRVGGRAGSLDFTAGDVLDVTFAAYAGEGTQRGSSSMRHDVDYALSIERELGKRNGRERLIGDYHSHPDGDGIPSEGDLRGWFRSLQLLGVRESRKDPWLLGDEVTPNCFLGLIVTRSAGGSWHYPQIWPWVMREHDGSVICEPAPFNEA